MAENTKRRYPSNRHKLHALKERLESEIAEKQEMLLEVTRLTRQADNAAIVHTALNYDITPEEFDRLMQVLRTDEKTPELPEATASVETQEDTPYGDERLPSVLQANNNFRMMGFDDEEDTKNDNQ